MKRVIKTAIFHLLCILIFALIYFYFSQHFKNGNEEEQDNNFTDFVLLSTTIQAGVGISDLHPISIYTKVVVILQHILLMFTHLITLYIFTL